MSDFVPVITIDGPSGSGKGTVTQRVADHLGWHVLDSGALYRLLGLAASKANVDFSNENKISSLADNLNVEFDGDVILLDGQDVSNQIRTETAGNNASKVAAMPAVRAALLDWQRRYATPPVWSRTDATWARRCSRMRRSRSFSQPVPGNAPKDDISS